MLEKLRSKSDVVNSIKWTIHKLGRRKHELQEKGEELFSLQLDELITTLYECLTNFENDGLSIDEVSDQLQEIWPELKETYEFKLQNEKKEVVLEWGEWRLETTIVRRHGYTTGYLKETIKPSDAQSSINIYSMIPPKISWPLDMVNQKGYVFFSTTATVKEIESLCSVPALPEEVDVMEAGLRVLNKVRAEDEWQRRVNWKRVNSIHNFINQEDNIITNAPILYINDHNAVKIADNGNDHYSLEADFSVFLREYKYDGEDTFIDHETEGETYTKDKRPLWLIDGQHRIRGLSQSEEGSDMRIPIIIISNKHDEGTILNPLSMVAKVFTEINTLQTPLDTLHELFLMHRFQIAHPIKKDRDFRQWDARDRKTYHSRANHLSYELAARLASREDSALFEKIQILDQNKGYSTIIKADQWLIYTKSWFTAAPYNVDSDKTDEEIIYTEVNNFFQALINTCNHDGWQDGKDRWIIEGASKSLIQGSAHFQMVLELYGTIHALAYDRYIDEILNNPEEIISVEVFEKVLKPLKWCDWLAKDNELRIFKGGGESKRRPFQVWIEDAVKGGQSFGYDDVMTNSILSERGKGLLAKPKDVDVEIISDTEWPSIDYPVIIKTSRPYNAMKVASWTILDDYENNITEEIGKIVTKCLSDKTEQKLIYKPFLDQVSQLKIRVEWINAAGNSKGTIILMNPNLP